MQAIRTPADVAAQFGANFDPNATMAENSACLSRRIYKNTACGAWADFMRRDVTHREQQEWTAQYAKIEGVWQLLLLSHADCPAEFSVCSGQVLEYFFPHGIDMGEFLDDAAKGAADLTLTETVEVEVKTGEEWIFRCGSIVEGIDAEVMPETVALPCLPEDIDRAVQCVEDAAEILWNGTHGCEDCGEERETGYRSINPDCISCDGEGTIL